MAISIPFSAEAVLSLVHVEDVARMLVLLAEAPEVRSSIYNTPVELWKANRLKTVVEETTGIHVELEGGANGGRSVMAPGSRTSSDFAFEDCRVTFLIALLKFED